LNVNIHFLADPTSFFLQNLLFFLLLLQNLVNFAASLASFDILVANGVQIGVQVPMSAALIIFLVLLIDLGYLLHAFLRAEELNFRRWVRHLHVLDAFSGCDEIALFWSFLGWSLTSRIGLAGYVFFHFLEA
jgi:hypothetical protein